MKLPVDSQMQHQSKKNSLKAALGPISTSLLSAGSSSSASGGSASSSDHDDSDSPPISPLRSPLFSPVSTTSSVSSSWGFSSSSSQGSQLSIMMDDGDSNGSHSSQCNSKEDRASYNTRFARYHLESYKQSDKLRWNFDFDHNRPLDSEHHHHHQNTTRYQWDPAL